MKFCNHQITGYGGYKGQYICNAYSDSGLVVVCPYELAEIRFDPLKEKYKISKIQENKSLTCDDFSITNSAELKISKPLEEKVKNS